MARRKTGFTEYRLNSLKPATDGEHYDHWDELTPGFGVRVSDTGRKTFVLAARFPGKSASRRKIGTYPGMSIKQARAKANEWRTMIERGIDPAAQIEQERMAAVRVRENSFARVADDYLTKCVIGPNPEKPRQRKAHDVARTFRNVFIPLWDTRPITDIDRKEIRNFVEDVRDYGTATALARRKVGKQPDRPEGAAGQARNLLGYLKAFFAWVEDREDYGLSASPCATLKPTSLFGIKPTRDHTLNRDELFAFWRATKRIGYPFGPAYRLLLLTLLRLNEVVDARRAETATGDWIIPPERMKATNDRAKAHLVPLTDDIKAELDALPKFTRGDYFFSFDYGASPAWVGTKVKRQLDARMLRTLRAMARLRGDDPKAVTLRPWKNHDLRRTAASEMSAELGIRDEIIDAIQAHRKQGTRRNYIISEYKAEKQRALEAWASRLRTIVEPDKQPGNVVSMAR